MRNSAFFSGVAYLIFSYASWTYRLPHPIALFVSCLDSCTNSVKKQGSFWTCKTTLSFSRCILIESTASPNLSLPLVISVSSLSFFSPPPQVLDISYPTAHLFPFDILPLRQRLILRKNPSQRILFPFRLLAWISEWFPWAGLGKEQVSARGTSPRPRAMVTGGAESSAPQRRFDVRKASALRFRSR